MQEEMRIKYFVAMGASYKYSWFSSGHIKGSILSALLELDKVLVNEM